MIVWTSVLILRDWGPLVYLFNALLELYSFISLAFWNIFVLLFSNPRSLLSSNNLNLGTFLVSSNPPLSKITWLIFPRFPNLHERSKCYSPFAEALGPLVLCSFRSIVLSYSVWPRPLILWFNRLSSGPLTLKIYNFLPSWSFPDMLEIESFIPQVYGPQSFCPTLLSRDENWSSWINAKTTFCGASGNVPDRWKKSRKCSRRIFRNDPSHSSICQCILFKKFTFVFEHPVKL